MIQIWVFGSDGVRWRKLFTEDIVPAEVFSAAMTSWAGLYDVIAFIVSLVSISTAQFPGTRNHCGVVGEILVLRTPPCSVSVPACQPASFHSFLSKACWGNSHGNWRWSCKCWLRSCWSMSAEHVCSMLPFPTLHSQMGLQIMKRWCYLFC